MNRPRLKSRVVLLTGGFAAALFAVTWGLTWHAQASQERWTRLINVELQAVRKLEELIRAQNAFTARGFGDSRAAAKYQQVERMLDHPSLAAVDMAELRARVGGFRRRLEARPPEGRLLAAAGRGVVMEAQRVAEERKREVGRQIPRLRRETRNMQIVGFSTAWILVVLGLMAGIMMMKNVVRPLEHLADVADRIRDGEGDLRARTSGDREIHKLAVSVNAMAQELNRGARFDDLTSLPNFRSFRERIDAEIKLYARYKSRFGILVLDLDRFKKYNDTWGHLAGNAALQRVAATLKSTLREVDFTARYGGEEFAVIVPHADLEMLSQAGERARASVEAMPPPPDGATLTISIGAALYPDAGVTMDELFRAADERLYEAKKRGRNMVVVRSIAPDARSAG